MTDSVHQMGLAEPNSSIHIKRVICLRWHIDHRQRRGVNKLIARANYKCIKGVLWIERQHRRFSFGSYCCPDAKPRVRSVRVARAERRITGSDCRTRFLLWVLGDGKANLVVVKTHLLQGLLD